MKKILVPSFTFLPLVVLALWWLQVIKDNNTAHLIFLLSIPPAALGAYVWITGSLSGNRQKQKFVMYIAGPVVALVGGATIAQADVIAGILFAVTILSVLLLVSNPPTTTRPIAVVGLLLFVVVTSAAAGYIIFIGLDLPFVTALIDLPTNVKLGLAISMAVLLLFSGVREAIKMIRRLRAMQSEEKNE